MSISSHWQYDYSRMALTAFHAIRMTLALFAMAQNGNRTMEKSTVADSWEEAARNILEYSKCISHVITQVQLCLCENKYYKYMKINF